jgi:hypothetical protein
MNHGGPGVTESSQNYDRWEPQSRLSEKSKKFRPALPWPESFAIEVLESIRNNVVDCGGDVALTPWVKTLTARDGHIRSTADYSQL